MEAMEARSRDEDEARRLLSPEDKINRCLPQKKRRERRKGGSWGRGEGTEVSPGEPALQPCSRRRPSLTSLRASRAGGAARGPGGKLGALPRCGPHQGSWWRSREVSPTQAGKTQPGDKNRSQAKNWAALFSTDT